MPLTRRLLVLWAISLTYVLAIGVRGIVWLREAIQKAKAAADAAAAAAPLESAARTCTCGGRLARGGRSVGVRLL